MEKRKLTKKDHFNMIIEMAKNANREDLVNFALHEIALLDKASNSSKENAEHTEIMALIVEVMKSVNAPITITELLKVNEELGAYSNQKVSALLTKLIAQGVVEREEIKRKAYFKLV